MITANHQWDIGTIDKCTVVLPTFRSKYLFYWLFWFPLFYFSNISSILFFFPQNPSTCLYSSCSFGWKIYTFWGQLLLEVSAIHYVRKFECVVCFFFFFHFFMAIHFLLKLYSNNLYYKSIIPYNNPQSTKVSEEAKASSSPCTSC